ncbi:tetraspanin-5 isoform X3 [Manis javanica]|uniref:tetraspanin-5 isoform X3 n=1 Tax=Manis javanica TaxID=9974 RepID=UPI003C6D0E75
MQEKQGLSGWVNVALRNHCEGTIVREESKQKGLAALPRVWRGLSAGLWEMGSILWRWRVALSDFLGIAFLGIGLWAWNEKFSVFLGIIFFLELTAGVLAFVFKDWIKDQLYFFINNNIRAYRDDIDLQNLIDFTQEYWQCCGAFGADDWNLNIYFNCTDSNASRERCGVPFSCCTKDPAEDVINTQCGYDARQKPEVDQQIVIYTKGCVPQFEKWLQDNLTIVAGIFIGIALLQIFGICLAQNLVSDIEAVRASW